MDSRSRRLKPRRHLGSGKWEVGSGKWEGGKWDWDVSWRLSVEGESRVGFMVVLGDLQSCEREKGDSGPFFARMRVMLVLSPPEWEVAAGEGVCSNLGYENSSQRLIAKDLARSGCAVAKSEMKTGEGESICDFTGKNGDDAGDGFLLVVK
ncbi:hypothetical protein H5410_019620 [Solanum commersonii]|uniref:Uncharacterized protein n=1 Tax=Solanum commersonii TaxID=4109 RepID=A0A9J5Z5R7_SOLCO|nr:hypothetical protein H5410_019620 [Solanum commersonii]